MAPIPIGQEEQPIQNLRDVIYSRRQCLLMSGYGLSALAKTTDGRTTPHSWQELFRGIAEKARKEGYISREELSTIQGLLTHRDWNRAGGELKSHFSGPRLRVMKDHLREALLEKYPIKSEAHQLVVSIPFQAYIVTTLDLFFEQIYKEFNEKKLMSFYNVSSALNFALNKESAFILKLHGDIEHQPLAYISDLDFRQRFSSIEDKLEKLLVDSSILFLGFEPDSPDMECLEHFCEQDLFNTYKMHWIIAPESQEDIFRKRLIEKYSYLRIIPYPEPADKGLIDFLEKLSPEPHKYTSSDKQASSKPSVTVPPQMPSKSCPLAILYAREDEFLWKKLEEHLVLLQNGGLITIWHSGNIPAGENITEATMQQIDKAKVILVLTSINFLSDEDFFRLVDTIALFHEGRIKKVLNIMLSSYDRQIGSINKLPLLYGNEKIIDLLEGGKQGQAFTKIVEQVRQMVTELEKTSNF